ncbi:MAG: DUF4255 domain-containing protein [Blastocatellia bacterium]
MPDALAIASATEALRALLQNGLNRYADRVGDVRVSILPPDRIATGPDERSQLNLFLYRVAPSAMRDAREVDDPARPARTALDLYYLLTAYGAQDFHTEVLLGGAIKLLLEAPLLASREMGTAMFPKLEAPVRITPRYLPFEEMSKLWSGLQARYRLSIVCQS